MYSPDGSYPYYQQQLQQLWAYTQRQEERLRRLEESVQSMRKELEELGRQRAIHIDRIEYKFDQLKVEQLDGTLTIGVSPSAMNEIEDMAVNGMPDSPPPGKGMNTAPPVPPAFTSDDYRQPPEEREPPIMEQQANQQLHDFLDREAMEELMALAAKQHMNVAPGESKRIMDDLRRQIEARVRHYSRTPGHNEAAGMESAEVRTHKLIEKTKSDIREGIRIYLNQYRQEKENGGDSS
ncbi:spore germination protein GerPC [Paenibacillus lutrae]|uniref:Spore germination protein GerPC n=1 Tax=Paenibacillus lutrae TaxID=2078573 RepID=A0A7X3FHP4_9BACL|nr:spore germination protein GerPC [Paenibacillus lutrae]MVO99816.1 hypothetical protein [Paenibacillus lutrae]